MKQALIKQGYIKKIVSKDGELLLLNYTNKANGFKVLDKVDDLK